MQERADLSETKLTRLTVNHNNLKELPRLPLTIEVINIEFNNIEYLYDMTDYKNLEYFNWGNNNFPEKMLLFLNEKLRNNEIDERIDEDNEYIMTWKKEYSIEMFELGLCKNETEYILK